MDEEDFSLTNFLPFSAIGWTFWTLWIYLSKLFLSKKIENNNFIPKTIDIEKCSQILYFKGRNWKYLHILIIYEFLNCIGVHGGKRCFKVFPKVNNKVMLVVGLGMIFVFFFGFFWVFPQVFFNILMKKKRKKVSSKTCL